MCNTRVWHSGRPKHIILLVFQLRQHLRRVMVPRGGIQVKEIRLRFLMVRTHIATVPTNRSTNKIFLWISSVPKFSVCSTPAYPHLIL